MKKIALIAALTAFSGFAVASDAQKITSTDTTKMYIGAGFSKYEINGVDSSFAYDVFAGYNIDYSIDSDNRFLNMLNFAAEVGYTAAEWELTSTYSYYGSTYRTKYDYEVGGLWGAGVVTMPFSERWDIGASLGYDLGDVDGILYGVHANWRVVSSVDFRFDYKSRDGMDGYAASVVYKF